MTVFVRVTSGRQLADLPPDTRIRVRGKPSTVGEYGGLLFPGNYPFLMGLAQLGVPIEVEETSR
jgi:hypothetical protein